MKKNSYLFIAGLISIAFLLDSCQSGSNLTIEKRKYRDGYFVDWGNGKEKVKENPERSPAASIANVKGIEKETLSIAPSDDQPKAAPVRSVEQLNTSKVKDAVEKAIANKKAISNSSKVIDEPVAMNSKSKEKLIRKINYALADVDKSQLKSSGGSTDTPEWVLAILCILLPPLAIFLAFGIGKEFWISIILTILFWIPGVIYAFIKIFG